MPAWPIGVTYTKGLLGVDQRTTVAESLKQARLERSAWTKRIETESFGSIQSDPKLMTIVRQTGRAAVRRQLRGVPRRRRERRQRLSQSHDSVLALGRHSGSACRDDPGRDQFAPRR